MKNYCTEIFENMKESGSYELIVEELANAWLSNRKKNLESNHTKNFEDFNKEFNKNFEKEKININDNCPQTIMFNLNSSWSGNFLELNSSNNPIVPQRTRPVRVAATPGVPPEKLQQPSLCPRAKNPHLYTQQNLLKKKKNRVESG
jgi:hypothetical protein